MLPYVQKCSLTGVLYQYLKADSVCHSTPIFSSSFFLVEVRVCIGELCTLCCLSQSAQEHCFPEKMANQRFKMKITCKIFLMCMSYICKISLLNIGCSDLAE